MRLLLTRNQLHCSWRNAPGSQQQSGSNVGRETTVITSRQNTVRAITQENQAPWSLRETMGPRNLQNVIPSRTISMCELEGVKPLTAIASQKG
jgi:hypothetical protein